MVLSGQTIVQQSKRKLSALRKFYSYMFKNNLIKTKNNTEKITMPKLNQKDIVYMDSDEVKSFLSLVNNGKITGSRMEEVYHDILGFRNTVIVSLLLTTGIRVSELVGLDINDVDQKRTPVLMLFAREIKKIMFIIQMI